MNNPNPTGCNVIETISVLKFPQVQGSLQLARKVALDQVAYENEARGVKSLKIQAIRRWWQGRRKNAALYRLLAWPESGSRQKVYRCDGNLSLAIVGVLSHLARQTVAIISCQPSYLLHCPSGSKVRNDIEAQDKLQIQDKLLAGCKTSYWLLIHNSGVKNQV